MPADLPYINACPIGCGDTLEHDGDRRHAPRAKCADAGNAVSGSARRAKPRYLDSMREFDVPEGTEPTDESRQRRFVQSERKLTQVVRRLNKSSPDVRLLDVGCSSGALVAAAQTSRLHRRRRRAGTESRCRRAGRRPECAARFARGSGLSGGKLRCDHVVRSGRACARAAGAAQRVSPRAVAPAVWRSSVPATPRAGPRARWARTGSIWTSDVTADT